MCPLMLRSLAVEFIEIACILLTSPTSNLKKKETLDPCCSTLLLYFPFSSWPPCFHIPTNLPPSPTAPHRGDLLQRGPERLRGLRPPEPRAASAPALRRRPVTGLVLMGAGEVGGLGFVVFVEGVFFWHVIFG